jgi:hypothetical protein
VVAGGLEFGGNHAGDRSDPDRGGKPVAEALWRIGKATGLSVRDTLGGPRCGGGIQHIIDSDLFAHAAKIVRKVYPGPGQQPVTLHGSGPGGLACREWRAGEFSKRQLRMDFDDTRPCMADPLIDLTDLGYEVERLPADSLIGEPHVLRRCLGIGQVSERCPNRRHEDRRPARSQGLPGEHIGHANTVIRAARSAYQRQRRRVFRRLELLRPSHGSGVQRRRSREGPRARRQPSLPYRRPHPTHARQPWSHDP